jgi:hypothetical protein
MQPKRASIVILFFSCMVLSCSLTATPIATADPTASAVFKTPEDIITSYFEGIAENNLQKILQTLAINEMSENFHFDLYTERVGAFIPTLSLAPSEYPLYVEANKMKLSGELMDQMKFFTYSLLSNEPVSEATPIRLDPERTKSFVENVDPGRLSSLSIKSIDLANQKTMSTTRYLENAAAIARVFGADESTERVALFLFEEKYYYVGFTLLRYGESWKISRQTSAMAATNALGVAHSTTPEEFETMISGD